MKNKISIYLIVSISILIGLLHFVIGPDYQGIWKNFVRGYLIDILLPMNLYLLLQIALRKKISVLMARIFGFLITFAIGIVVEVFQYNKIEFLGSTYDPRDVFMYLTGIGLGILIDLTIIEKFEKQAK